MKLPGPRPHSPSDLKHWLESYQEWQEALESGGLYSVDPEGTQVRSNRAGRPTESAAIRQADISERCRVVCTWLSALSGPQRLAAEKYLSGKTAREISHVLRIDYNETASLIRILPTLIYLEWYGDLNIAVDWVSN